MRQKRFLVNNRVVGILKAHKNQLGNVIEIQTDANGVKKLQVCWDNGGISLEYTCGIDVYRVANWPANDASLLLQRLNLDGEKPLEGNKGPFHAARDRLISTVSKNLTSKMSNNFLNYLLFLSYI